MEEGGVGFFGQELELGGLCPVIGVVASALFIGGGEEGAAVDYGVCRGMAGYLCQLREELVEFFRMRGRAGVGKFCLWLEQVIRERVFCGVDGIVSEDKLGFNKIYIQAKCWDKASTVSRPEIQKFVGALAGMGANKGLFITTSQYSKQAIEYAKSQHIAKVVLVDGARLAKLMIEHGVGVSPVSQYVIKRIDSDYFNPN